MSESAGSYYFKEGLSCLFEMATDNARQLLPGHLQPLEKQPDTSVLSVSVFDFFDGDAGPYQELVLSILVPPLVALGERLPKAALYPFVVATSTEMGRSQGIERWKLPHLMRDIDIAFAEGDREMDLRVEDRGAPVLELTTTKHTFDPTELLFHSFMSDDEGNYKANITMKGEGYSEHEFERGALVLFEHELTEGLNREEVSDCPFREQWMRNGVEIFSPLETLT
ncbi:MAG: hypothetical protein ABGX31_03740 [bacterium]|jgi:hypothetical protein